MTVMEIVELVPTVSVGLFVHYEAIKSRMRWRGRDHEIQQVKRAIANGFGFGPNSVQTEHQRREAVPALAQRQCCVEPRWFPHQ